MDPKFLKSQLTLSDSKMVLKGGTRQDSNFCFLKFPPPPSLLFNSMMFPFSPLPQAQVGYFGLPPTSQFPQNSHTFEWFLQITFLKKASPPHMQMPFFFFSTFNGRSMNV